jgi:rusticyanin
MKQFMLLLLGLMLLQPASKVFAKDELPFHFSGVTAKQLTSAQFDAAEKTRTEGVVDKDKNTLTFSQKEVNLVVRTGPEDDMLSYRIQGLRNPTIVVQEMTTVKVLFVNADEDMSHDFRFGAVNPPFKAHPDISKTAGSDQLLPSSEDAYNAQEFSYHVHSKSTFHYFCSVGSHAKNGMWGTVVVGDQPIPVPNKETPHKDHGMEGMPGM